MKTMQLLLLTEQTESKDLALRAKSSAAKCNIKDVTRNRHRGNPESEAANERVSLSKSVDRVRIYQTLQDEGPRTSKELSRELAMRYTTVSARLSELKAMQLIEKTGERRDGAAVVRVKS
jgi:DNA-binding transcriptional ArsR family regulator